MNDTHAQNLTELFYSLEHVRYVELLPYHPFGISKAEQLGISHAAEYRRPTEKETADFAARLKAKRRAGKMPRQHFFHPDLSLISGDTSGNGFFTDPTDVPG